MWKVMIMICIAVLITLGCRAKSPDYSDTQESSERALYYETDDVLGLYGALGNTFESFEIQNQGGKEVKYLAFVDISGKFNEETVNGSMCFSTIEDQLVLKDFAFAIYKTSYEDVESLLIKLYGSPVDEGIEPYVEVNGGASRWARFQTETADILVQKGDRNLYTWLHYQLHNSE